jgi:hypothetical protein
MLGARAHEDLAASVRVTSHHLHGEGIRRVTSALTRGTG